MHYFVVGRGNRDEFDLGSTFICQFKAVLAKALTPNTEITFSNPHGGEIDSSYFQHETSKKRQLTVINWGYHTNDRSGSSKTSRWLSNHSFCSDETFEPNPSTAEVIFYADDKDEIPLASFDTEKNRLYLLWDAIHHRRDNEVEMFKRIISFFGKKLNEHPLFQPGPPPEEKGYNQTITFNKNLVGPQLRKFKNDYQEKQRSINEYRTYMMQLLSETKELSRQIAVLENAQSIPPITVKNKWVRHINVSSNGFSIFTYPLFITYVDKDAFSSFVRKQKEYDKYATNLPDIIENIGKKYGWYVGQFQIDIDLMNDWKIRFHNLDNKRIAFWHDRGKPSCHPHVDGDGKGCLGNLSELIAQTQSNFEIEPLIDVLIGYIQSANIQDPAGNTLPSWDLVDMTTMKNVLTNEDVIIDSADIGQFSYEMRDCEMSMED